MTEYISPITLSDAAVNRIKIMIADRKKPTVGVRIGVCTKGCSGLTYTIEFADEKNPTDDVVETKGVTLLIDHKATIFIFGTEMDFVEENFQSGFVFRNPNEKGRCNCGKSFHV
ncbi:MAG: iron-sulfur cluster assembly accessory protein [Rhodospirillaceae bacterium]|jgi:iron-sulfur cluster assembly protein|nr:iron-sulfur cluster assembly accessory protein [Rhodospirillaceae bacterium]